MGYYVAQTELLRKLLDGTIGRVLWVSLSVLYPAAVQWKSDGSVCPIDQNGNHLWTEASWSTAKASVDGFKCLQCGRVENTPWPRKGTGPM